MGGYKLEKAVKSFFKKIGLDDEDVNFITTSYPELDTYSSSKILGNAKLVVDYGYPLEDLEFLILINPGFLISNTETLKEILISLGADVADALKADPFII